MLTCNEDNNDQTLYYRNILVMLSQSDRDNEKRRIKSYESLSPED